MAAINLRGICLAQKSQDLLALGPEALEKNPQLWQESVNIIKNSLLDNQFAYEYKPSQAGRIRYLNNKVFNSTTFLAGVVELTDEKIREALQQLGDYEDIEAFSKNALSEMTECYLLTQDRSAYFETEAELHAVKFRYYLPRDNEKAMKAREVMIAKLTEAINNNLLSTRGKSTFEEAAEYFTEDPLLKPLFADPKDYRTIDPKIKAAIERLLKP